MIPKPGRKAVASALVTLVAALALGEAPAQAQVVKPFKISGVGVALSGLPLPGQPAGEHLSLGVATHLGQYHGDGTVATDFAVFDPKRGVFTGEFGGGSPYVFTGADGDRLVVWYGRVAHGASEPGTFTLTIVGALPDGTPIVTAAFIAEFVAQPDLSTGKFAGVTGSWIMYAETDPFVLGSTTPVIYSWSGEGKLTFRR